MDCQRRHHLATELIGPFLQMLGKSIPRALAAIWAQVGNIRAFLLQQRRRVPICVTDMAILAKVSIDFSIA